MSRVDKTTQAQAYNQQKPQRKVAKALMGTVTTAAIVTAGLAWGAKNGKFAVTEESSAVAKKVLPYLDKAGKEINVLLGNAKTKVTGSKMYQDLVAKADEAGVTSKVKSGLEAVKGFVGDMAEKVKSADLKEKTKGFVDDVCSKVKSLFNEKNVEKVVTEVVEEVV